MRLKNLYSLLGFQNIDVMTIHDLDGHPKEVYIYDDHRYLLGILFVYWYLNKRGLNVVSFNRFDDYSYSLPKADLLKMIGVANLAYAQDEDFWRFMEFDMPYDNNNCITIGMQLGLINDSVSIGNSDILGILSRNNRYQFASEDIHRMFAIKHLKHELEHGMTLDIGTDHPNAMDIDGILGLHLIPNNKIPKHPYVLDIDLSCFTYDVKNGVSNCWPEFFFHEEFSDEISIYLENLIASADIITIARSPKRCGGPGSSAKALAYIDRYFFNGELRAVPIR